jgi:hypothetical protein
MRRDYCVCYPRDGSLYVEFPSYAHLRNLLLNQRFRGDAHFRTVDGYVPYYGAVLAFDVRRLVLAGVQPLWYLRAGGDRERAAQQLIEDGVYRDEHEVYARNGHHYGDECEWEGPAGMRFDPRWIETVWIWPGRASQEELAARRDEVAWLLPDVPIVFDKPELPEGGRKSCKR